MKIRYWTVALLLFGCAAAPPADGSVFEFDADLLAPGTLYHYVKSNIDGSRPSNVALYLASTDELESFKYHDGATEASLVKATMDWSSFTVRRFESWRVSRAGDNVLRATLQGTTGEPDLHIQLGGRAFMLTIANWPWHSYDFDFASLNLAFRFLVDPKAPFTIGIADVNRGTAGPPFVDKGTVLVTPAGAEKRHGTRCRVYRIDGEGLENRGGTIWVDKKRKHIVDYEIDLPDEPGFESGKLQLRAIERLSPAQWEQFKSKRLAGH